VVTSSLNKKKKKKKMGRTTLPPRNQPKCNESAPLLVIMSLLASCCSQMQASFKNVSDRVQKLEEALYSRNTASSESIENKLRESAFHTAVLTDPEIAVKKKTIVIRFENFSRSEFPSDPESIATLVTGGIRPVSVLRMRKNQKGKPRFLLVFATFAEAKRARQNISAKHKGGDKSVAWDFNWSECQRALYHLSSMLNERISNSASLKEQVSLRFGRGPNNRFLVCARPDGSEVMYPAFLHFARGIPSLQIPMEGHAQMETLVMGCPHAASSDPPEDPRFSTRRSYAVCCWTPAFITSTFSTPFTLPAKCNNLHAPSIAQAARTNLYATTTCIGRPSSF
jgi:hypothetical protein